jgi:hypothetical protein
MFEWIIASMAVLSHFGFLAVMDYRNAKNPPEIKVYKYSTSWADFKAGKNMREPID